MLRRIIMAVACAAATSAWLANMPSAFAQLSSGKTMVVVVSSAAGGAADAVARIIVDRIRSTTNAPVVVENKVGGGGVVAAIAVKTAPADGSMVFLADLSSFAINPALMASLPYDPVGDFRAVAGLFYFPAILSVPKSSPARSVADLVALANKTAGGLQFASQGPGSGGHLLGAMFTKATGAPFMHVPYRGNAQAVTDLIAGRVDLLFSSYLSMQGFAAEGSVRILAVASKKRISEIPDVPTMREAGYPDVELDQWYGAAVKSGTPDAVVESVYDRFVGAITAPDIVQKLMKQGVVVATSSPADFTELIKNEILRMEPIVKASGAATN
jgi:tripartite-type tricarboxylate transporter receptor subunit TctC